MSKDPDTVSCLFQACFRIVLCVQVCIERGQISTAAAKERGVSWVQELFCRSRCQLDLQNKLELDVLAVIGDCMFMLGCHVMLQG